MKSKKMKKRAIILFVVVSMALCVSCTSQDTGISKMEEEARATQNIADTSVAYHDEDEAMLQPSTGQKAQLTLFLFEEKTESAYTYSLYRDGEFVEGGDPMIDENNPLSVLRSSSVEPNVFLLFYNGDDSVDKVVFADEDENALYEIGLEDNTRVKILAGKDFSSVTCSLLVKDNAVVKKSAI